ncbi:hypothetical protein HY604_01155 [Candidatus Peregrinibacteria bacterium]|nr:hypothetical protein [Candidatus Peregrinibacteria bacterium]
MKAFPKGSVALVSIMIISAITLIVVISMTEINYSTSSQSLNSNSDKTAYYVAQACLEEATIQLEADLSYSAGTLNFDADTTCDISVTDNGQKNVTITVNYLDYSSTFNATFSYEQSGEATNLHIINWSET